MGYMEYGGLSQLKTKEKAGFFAFLIFACAIIILGFRGIGNAIKSPFAKSFAPPPPTEEQIKQKQIADLKKKDTDGDGLSDYDELYVYNTSPYLASTASDGTTDKEKVIRGMNPNCPQGKRCFGGWGSGDLSASSTANFAPPIQVDNTGQILLQTLLNSNPNPSDLRQLLIQNGVDKALIDGLSDSALLDMAKKAAYGAGNVAGAGSPGMSSSTSDLGQPPQGTNNQTISATKAQADQLRSLLRAQGVSEAQLQRINDNDLLKVYQEILSEQNKTTTSTP